MKFKLFSLALLLVCFVFLGILSGVIPVRGPDAAAVFAPASLPAASPSAPAATRLPSPSPATAAARTVTPPSPRLAGTAAPVSTAVLAGPTASPVRATASPMPAAASPAVTTTPAVTASSAVTATPAPSGPPPSTAAPTAAPTIAPTAPPTAAPASAPTIAPRYWEPDAEVISTTITWRDPLQNDTDIPLDGAALLDEPPQITLPAEGCQVLIIHTHGTEAYTPDGGDQYEATADYRTTDTDHSVIRVGMALAQALEEQGLRVLVDQSLYDWPSYNGSYERAGAAIEQYLADEPQLALIIDLHRDAIGDEGTEYRTVSDKLDTPAAQMMFVVGTDESLPHPNWRDNLALAVSLQSLVEEKYPHLMRPTLVSSYRYNQQYTPGSLLLEIGTAGNTLEEAITAAQLFADAVGPALAARVEE